MKKKILILIIGFLIIVSCSRNYNFNNGYSEDENRIIFDFLSSKEPEKDKLFMTFIDNEDKDVSLIGIMKSSYPVYPVFDFTVDSINGNIVIFQSENPMKELSHYDEFLKKGYVVIDNMLHEDFNTESWYIV